MATSYGNPQMVTDGLVLYLDAGNSLSYPGSELFGRDLSGNSNTGTLLMDLHLILLTPVVLFLMEWMIM
jgi:hypothetical protein